MLQNRIQYIENAGTTRFKINKPEDTNLEDISVSSSPDLLDQVEHLVRVSARYVCSQWRAHFVFACLARHQVQ